MPASPSAQYFSVFNSILRTLGGNPRASSKPNKWGYATVKCVQGLYWPPLRLDSDKAVSLDSQYVEKMCIATTVAHGRQHSA